MLRLLGVLLAIWIVFVVLGAVIKALFWLVTVGVVLFLATAAFGWARRETLRSR